MGSEILPERSYTIDLAVRTLSVLLAQQLNHSIISCDQWEISVKVAMLIVTMGFK